jgi:ABC-type lipoprotein release transport system permease subunit
VVPVLLLAAALLASLLPALRAAGTDPIRALRED